MSHRNLVSLIGYCLEDNQQMLIYEFMHKGSLRDHLYGTINSYSTFDFEQLIDPQVLIHIKKYLPIHGSTCFNHVVDIYNWYCG